MISVHHSTKNKILYYHFSLHLYPNTKSVIHKNSSISHFKDTKYLDDMIIITLNEMFKLTTNRVYSIWLAWIKTGSFTAKYKWSFDPGKNRLSTLYLVRLCVRVLTTDAIMIVTFWPPTYSQDSISRAMKNLK